MDTLIQQYDVYAQNLLRQIGGLSNKYDGRRLPHGKQRHWIFVYVREQFMQLGWEVSLWMAWRVRRIYYHDTSVFYQRCDPFLVVFVCLCHELLLIFYRTDRHIYKA